MPVSKRSRRMLAQPWAGRVKRFSLPQRPPTALAGLLTHLRSPAFAGPFGPLRRGEISRFLNDLSS